MHLSDGTKDRHGVARATAPPIGGAEPTMLTDQTGRTWLIQVGGDVVRLISSDELVDFPRERWARDIHVSQHGDGFILRFETYERSVVFLATRSAVATLVAHLSLDARTVSESTNAEAEAIAEAPLLWPKVSPLAVWALICSSVAFLPVIGVIPALVTVVLLVLHRAKVRKSRAFGHSRKMCVAAVLFLVPGVFVSAISTVMLFRNVTEEIEARSYSIEEVPDEAEEETSEPVAESADRASLAQFSGWFDKDRHWGLLILGLVVMIGSLSVHECAHAITAWWLGDDFAHRLGRVTLNPLSHIDPIGTLVLPLMFAWAGTAGFGFAKPVPVQLGYVPRPRRAHILISLAGPGSNLLLAAGSLLILLAIGAGSSLLWPGATIDGFTTFSTRALVMAHGMPPAYLVGPLCTGLKMMFIVNVSLAFFNLIPIPPLDGSWILGNFFPLTIGRFFDRIRCYGWILFLGLIYSGVLQYYMYVPFFGGLLPGFLLLKWCTAY